MKPIGIEPADEAYAHTTWGEDDAGTHGVYVHPMHAAGVKYEFGVVVVQRRAEPGDDDFQLRPTADGAGLTESDLVRLRDRIDELLELRRKVAEFGP